MIAAAVVLAALCGLWQIDLVRQNAELFWLSASGQGWKLQGKIRNSYVWSPALRQKRRVVVYLPADYGSDVHRRFPVLYLLHGSPGVLDDWLRYGRAPEDVEQLWSHGRIPEMILVMPDGQGMGYLGDSEYIDAPNGGGRAGSNVGTFIWRDLVTWVDGHYRTVASRDGRILAGASSGGYGAVNLGLQHPDEFSSLFSFSGYFQADDSGWARPVWGYHPDPRRLRQESPLSYVPDPSLLATPAGGSGVVPRTSARGAASMPSAWRSAFIYMGDGMGERPPYPQQSAAFAQVMTDAGIPFKRETTPGRHSWDVWRTQLVDALLAWASLSRGRRLNGPKVGAPVRQGHLR